MDLRYQEPETKRANGEAVQALQLERLKALLAKTWEVNAFYREHWQAAGAHPDQVNTLGR